MRSVKIFVATVSIALFLCGSATVAHAQFAAPVSLEGLNLTVSPITITLETDPGVPVRQEVKLRNNGTQPETIAPRLAKFTADETGAGAQLINFDPGDETAQWVTFDEPAFTVLPGEWKTVQFTFSPPGYAALNYFYALVFTRKTTVQPLPGESIVVGAPAVLVLANVHSPNAKRQLELVSFSTPSIFFEYLPAEFQVRVKNTGNTFLAPLGNIFIDGQGKKDLAVLSYNKDGHYVLPNSDRLYTVPWEDGFPVRVPKTEGNEQVKNSRGEQIFEVQWDFSKADRFRLGRYTAHLIMVYDNGERDVPIESQITFWIIPWKILVFVGAVSALSGVGLMAVLRVIVRKLRKHRV